MVSTMACVYIFSMWSFLPLFWYASEPIVLYVSSGFLQLVLLPMIMVGQNLLGNSQERRSIADHSAIRDISKEMHILLESAKIQEQNMVIVLARLEYLESQLAKKD